MNQKLVILSGPLLLLAALTACGGSTQPGLVNTPTGIAHEATASRLLKSAKTANLLYTTKSGTVNVYVYAYPSGKNMGVLSGFSQTGGLCNDSQGDVFVVDAGSEMIDEFAHGGTTVVASYNDAGNSPISCAVDTKTGSLAVAGNPSASNSANIAIFQSSEGLPTVYPDSSQNAVGFCTYDANGNLFISGYSQFLPGTIGELPAGENKVVSVFISQKLNPGGGIQWDGSNVVIGNPTLNHHGPSTLDEVQISGSSATLVGTVTLYGGTGKKDKNPYGGNEFWISRDKVVDETSHAFATWKYPTGGYPLSRKEAAHIGDSLTLSYAPQK